MIVRIHFWAAAILLFIAPALAGGDEAATSDALTLTIRNDGADTLRCAAVLAHFMSETLGAIAPGDRLTVMLRRDPANGTLALGPREDRDVPLENILCGRDADWTASKGDLPLSAVRTGAAARLEARCGLSDGRVVCAVADIE